jgi:FKBP-type peptidyl-prolyl cis-trans isomerase
MSKSALDTGKAFLADNATKPGVVTTPSGLQYLVLCAGEGKSPKAKDTVVVNYRGTLINGVEFDSSYLAGREPAEFPLKRVIKGWTEGLQLMQEGAKYRFFIPSELAYGKRGAGIDIGPNEALIFEVELLKVWED